MLHVCYQYVKFCQAYKSYTGVFTPRKCCIPQKANPFSLDLGPISECCQKVAERELRETPENVNNGLRELRRLLAEDNTMHYITNEDFLKIFLRPCKYYAHEAYKLMKSIALFRLRYKDMYYSLLPEHEKSKIMTNGVVNVLTNRDQHGRRILVVNCGAVWDTKELNTDQLLRILYIIQIGAILEPETQVHGIVILFDLKGMGMSQVRAFTPTFGIKLMSLLQDATPLRFKALHIVNNPLIWSIVWKILLPLQSQKTRTRTHIYGYKLKGLHKHIHPDCLPQDWGGNLERVNYSSKEWWPCIEGYTDFFKIWNSCGQIENKMKSPYLVSFLI